MVLTPFRMQPVCCQALEALWACRGVKVQVCTYTGSDKSSSTGKVCLFVGCLLWRRYGHAVGSKCKFVPIPVRMKVAVPVRFVCWLLACLTSQQHASVTQGRICSDNFTCCHTEIEAADQTFYLTQSQYTDTGPTSHSTDPATPGAWQGSQ